MPAEQLPEGTDAIVTGAGVDERDEDTADAVEDAAAALTVSTPPPAADDNTGADDMPDDDTGGEPAAPQSFSSRIEGLKGQAGDRARTFVEDARTRATDGIDDVVRMIHDAADEVDAKVGAQYGDYVRRAAGSVSGLSDAIKAKDVDTIFADAREFIQKSPGIAIGAAAAIGFVVARLARAGVAEASAPEPTKAA